MSRYQALTEEREVKRLVNIYQMLEKEIKEKIPVETNLSISHEKAVELMVSSRFTLMTLANSIAERTYKE